MLRVALAGATPIWRTVWSTCDMVNLCGALFCLALCMCQFAAVICVMAAPVRGFRKRRCSRSRAALRLMNETKIVAVACLYPSLKPSRISSSSLPGAVSGHPDGAGTPRSVFKPTTMRKI